jgi:hypothetical protein
MRPADKLATTQTKISILQTGENMLESSELGFGFWYLLPACLGPQRWRVEASLVFIKVQLLHSVYRISNYADVCQVIRC